MNGIIIGLIAAFGIAIISLIITSLFRVSNRVDDARKEIGDKIDDGRKEISSKVDNVSNKIDGLGGKIDGLGSKVDKLPIEFIKLLRLIRQEEGPGGPNPRERENELLDKLGTEQISYDECIELRSILREELEDARRRNDAFDRFVISGILVHIRIVLEEISKSGGGNDQ